MTEALPIENMPRARRNVIVLLLALIFAGNNASGYMITGGFILNHTTSADIVPV